MHIRERQNSSTTDTPIDHNYHEKKTVNAIRWEENLSQDYWDYRKKWEKYPKEKIVSKFPIHLDIEATTACNLKCDMCPRTELVKSGKMWNVESIDFELYKKIIDEGVNKGLCSIKYNFLGEPTLNTNLIDMIRYAKEHGVIDVMFNTNGTLLNESLAKDLINSGLDKLFFSFDSPYPNHYNEIRIGADYKVVLENIKRFVKIRNEMNSPTPFTRVSMVLMKDNQDEWSDYVKLFSPIVDAVAYVDYLDQGGINNPERTLVKLDSEKRNFCCPQLWQRMFIHPDGVATMCCMDGLREIQMGNVNESTIEEIWNSDKYNEIRNLHASGRYDEIPLCKTCALAKY